MLTGKALASPLRTSATGLQLTSRSPNSRRSKPHSEVPVVMDPDAARTARESLDLAFHMSNLLDTGLDRHTLSVLIALCDLGLNPEALAALVKELRREPHASSLPATPTAPSRLS